MGHWRTLQDIAPEDNGELCPGGHWKGGHCPGGLWGTVPWEDISLDDVRILKYPCPSPSPSLSKA